MPGVEKEFIHHQALLEIIKTYTNRKIKNVNTRHKTIKIIRKKKVKIIIIIIKNKKQKTDLGMGRGEWQNLS